MDQFQYLFTTRFNQEKIESEFDQKQKEIEERIEKHINRKAKYKQDGAVYQKQKQDLAELMKNSLIEQRLKDKTERKVKKEKKRLESEMKKLWVETGYLQAMIKMNSYHRDLISKIKILETEKPKSTKRKRSSDKDRNETNRKKRRLTETARTTISETARRKSSFKPPGRIKDKSHYNRFKPKKSGGVDGYMKMLTDSELIRSTSRNSWYWCKALIDSGNKKAIQSDQRYLGQVLTIPRFRDLLFEFVWFYKDLNKQYVFVGRIIKFVYLQFDELRSHKHFNVYATQIDSLKIDEKYQLSYINVNKLNSAEKTSNEKYEILLGGADGGDSAKDGANDKFQRLQQTSAIKSEAIRVKIYFNDVHKVEKDNIIKAEKEGGRGCNYEVIGEFIYYLNFDKIPLYYLITLNTES